MRVSISLNGFFFSNLRLPGPCHHLISFVPVRPGPKGRVGSTWARISRPPPISRHLPAWYQSTLYSLPAEVQPTLKETEGDAAWWRNGVHGREERDKNRDGEWEKAGRPLSGILNLPWCQGSPSCSACQKIYALSEPRHTRARAR